MEKLRQVAEEFLGTYNRSGRIPVPIEDIVEFGFNIDIVPTPGLHGHFDIDSYPSSDLTEFHVDEYVYRRQECRYRFSLAHELSHLLVHRDIFSQLTFSTIQEWKAVACSIPEDQYSWIEWQAYTLAGLILVPREPLIATFVEVAARAESAGIVVSIASDETRKIMESHIAKHFNVNRPVIQRRIKADALWPS